jgi:hypothetical protein
MRLGRTPRRTRECGAPPPPPTPAAAALLLLLKGDTRRDEKGEKESEGGGYEVAVIPRNAALCSERKMPLADRSWPAGRRPRCRWPAADRASHFSFCFGLGCILACLFLCSCGGSCSCACACAFARAPFRLRVRLYACACAYAPAPAPAHAYCACSLHNIVLPLQNRMCPPPWPWPLNKSRWWQALVHPALGQRHFNFAVHSGHDVGENLRGGATESKN